jgi:hypothetical protein
MSFRQVSDLLQTAEKFHRDLHDYYRACSDTFQAAKDF